MNQVRTHERRRPRGARMMIAGAWALLAIPVLPAGAAHAETAQSGAQAVQVAPGTPAPPGLAAPPMTAERRELAAVRAEAAAAIRPLAAEYRATHDPAARRALRTRAAAIKRSWMLRSLEIVARHARLRGDERAALDAERMMRSMTSPRPRPAPGAEGSWPSKKP